MAVGVGSLLLDYRQIRFLLILAAAFPFATESGIAAAADADTPPALRRQDVSPSPELEPSEVVQIQIEALRDNDEADNGIAVAFRFASPRNKASTGPLLRFIRMIKEGPYRLMLEFEHASYMPTLVEGVHAVQRVTLVGRQEIRSYDFLLQRQAGPPCEGCWMTEAVIVVPGVEKAV
jgi:hypothetical protein